MRALGWEGLPSGVPKTSTALALHTLWGHEASCVTLRRSSTCAVNSNNASRKQW